ncbi:MAG: hypothetical protein IPQ23_10825 [Cytophagaceae bacterium]|nr:hypothetical protein [Cytophagaceae bacterium]
MKKSIFLISLISFLSCNEKETRQTRLIFQNHENEKITVKFFPNANYKNGENMYKGDENNTFFLNQSIIESNADLVLFTSSNEIITPTALINSVFDSILVSNPQDKITLKKGGTSIFDDDKNWHYEENHFELPTQFKRNPVVSSDYTYDVSLLFK